MADLSSMLLCSSNQIVRVYNSTGGVVKNIETSDPVLSASFNKKANGILHISKRYFSFEAVNPATQPTRVQSQSLACARFSSDCKLTLLTSSHSGALYVYDNKTFKYLPEVPVHGDRIATLATSFHSNLVMTSSASGSLALLTARDKERKVTPLSKISNLSNPTVVKRALAVGSTERSTWVAAGASDGRLGVWDVQSNKPLCDEVVAQSALRGVGFLAGQGGYTVTAQAEDGTLLIRDLRAPGNSVVRRAPGRASCLALRDDGARLAVGGQDGCVYSINVSDLLRDVPSWATWDLGTHKPLADLQFQPHSTPSSSALGGSAHASARQTPGSSAQTPATGGAAALRTPMQQQPSFTITPASAASSPHPQQQQGQQQQSAQRPPGLPPAAASTPASSATAYRSIPSAPESAPRSSGADQRPLVTPSPAPSLPLSSSGIPDASTSTQERSRSLASSELQVSVLGGPTSAPTTASNSNSLGASTDVSGPSAAEASKLSSAGFNPSGIPPSAPVSSSAAASGGMSTASAPSVPKSSIVGAPRLTIKMPDGLGFNGVFTGGSGSMSVSDASPSSTDGKGFGSGFAFGPTSCPAALAMPPSDISGPPSVSEQSASARMSSLRSTLSAQPPPPPPPQQQTEQQPTTQQPDRQPQQQAPTAPQPQVQQPRFSTPQRLPSTSGAASDTIPRRVSTSGLLNVSAEPSSYGAPGFGVGSGAAPSTPAPGMGSALLTTGGYAPGSAIPGASLLDSSMRNKVAQLESSVETLTEALNEQKFSIIRQAHTYEMKLEQQQQQIEQLRRMVVEQSQQIAALSTFGQAPSNLNYNGWI